ncbi:hypothetical protein NE848_05765 [Gramella jeungdoensis]|uniref:Uncharacterized protein n=1 Tax=Gramella jeungdoensis TaxID=708091 RepID=A0ABT0Z254_9FLAO|nr:hypothetical protein [Gramella jeungdoensis]MCM8568874.1 hypothetical protein [Gramella jeungdoensis]
MFNNRTEITLYSVLGPKTLYKDPPGYKNSELDLKRSEATFGIFLKVENNLEFIGEAKQYLENLYALYGVHAKCRMIRKEQHPTTDDWELHSEGFLDFSTREIENGKLTLKFVEGGLREILTSQLREKFELNRTTDIEGNPITTLKRDDVLFEGREIFLLSRWENQETTDFSLHSGEWNSSGANREGFRPAPCVLVSNADPENISQPQNVTFAQRRSDISINQMFYLIADRDHGKVKVPINLSFRINGISQHLVSVAQFKVTLRRYLKTDVDNTLVYQDEQILINVGDPRDHDQETFSYNGTVELDIKKDESYGLFFWIDGAYGGGVAGDGYIEVFFDNYTFNQEFREDSFFGSTKSPCMTAWDAFNRLSEIYTGNVNSFESYLLDGRDTTLLTDSLHNLIFTPGGWVRNLKKKDDNDNLLEWPLELSFKDAYKAIHAVLPVGYGIGIEGNKQKILFEDLRFFFQRTIVGHLGKLSNIKRQTASEFCYQSLKFGYLKGGEYEKPLGLDEYNTQMTSRTPLTITDNEYEALGTARTDAYGLEDARRMQYADYPDEDTPYDRDNFLIDVKDTQRQRRNKLFEVRKWQDDFEEQPTGTYAPDTGFNYNLTPARNRQRHSWWFNNGIVKLQDKNIQFLNAKGNSELKTKKAGEGYVKENADVPIADLNKPLFEPEWIDAEKHFDKELWNKLLDTTLIDGRRINNYYGLWEFTNEDNRSEYAYIFSVKSKDKMTFRLLKAYGI